MTIRRFLLKVTQTFQCIGCKVFPTEKKMSSIRLSKATTPVLGIVGHAGCGHANSHLGFIQDDSGGLSAVMKLLERATGLDLTISAVEVETGTQGSFTVKTVSGGCARAKPRRGITAFEAELAQRIVGDKAVCSQALAMKAFGRILGQGAMECPVALQTAVANAAVDSFLKNYPEHFIGGTEEVPGNIGRFLIGNVEIDGVPAAVMGLVNATDGGLGPNEDVEGNVNLAGKQTAMAESMLDRIPTFVLEGKVCASPLSDRIDKPTFVTRAFPKDDNEIVALSLVEAARELNLPILYPADFSERKKNALRTLTEDTGAELVRLSTLFSQAQTSREKVELIAKINRYASEDVGGVTFMSNDIHEVMGGIGQIPGTSACLSLFISREECRQSVYPILSEADTENYADLVMRAVSVLNRRLSEALARLEIRNQERFSAHLTVR